MILFQFINRFLIQILMGVIVLGLVCGAMFHGPEEKIKGIESVLTIVGGQIVYGAQEFQGLDPTPLPVLPEWSPIKVYGGYGAPLDIRKAARADVPIPQHHHCAEAPCW